MNAAIATGPSLVGLCLREAGYEFLRQLRTPAVAVPTLAFPLVFYVLFGLVLPGKWGQYDKTAYLLATYGVFGVIGPALFGFGVGLALERHSGWLELKRVSPMPIGAYFFSKIAMSLGFGLIVVVLLSIAAIGFGGVRIDPITWLKLTGVLLVGTLPFCAIGLWVGSLVSGQAAVAVINLIYLPMSVLSGLWLPLFAFPVILQKFAVIWPAWHLAQLALGMIGQAQDAKLVLHTGVLLATSVLFLSLAALKLRER
ncbi:MAG: ABC transporter permease [Xanthomonadales bacterium]|nr:hypothetical protein [Xanthomonadales bacterium]MCC6593467.1 ABC transporter permease [Xanthomonadales bacterium]MCE7929882.1 ABC transporter permease [Xanthomonadales bacterium PRO6]